MQIVIVASGTRGDVQPAVALALALKNAGYKVRLIAGVNFTDWIESFGLEMYPTLDMEDLMQSEAGIKWVETRNQFKQLKYMKQLLNDNMHSMNADMLAGTEDADLIIGGFTSEPFVQAIVEKRGTPAITLALQPYRATRSGAASLVTFLPHTNSFINHIGGRIGGYFIWSMASDAVNTMRNTLGLVPHTARSYQRVFNDIPALYAFSPHVVPPVNDSNATTTGYLFLEEADYTPPQDLTDFLNAGDKPLYIGFGSMSSSDPQRTMNRVVEALTENNLRGVLAKGWSGVRADNLPDHVFMLDSVPHTWLFPQMCAVVHHGGAGTTAAGLRAGIPTMIIPHMADQPYWARRVHHLGVGVKPLERAQLSVEALSKRFQQLTSDTTIQNNAIELGEKIRAEDGTQNAVNYINTFMNA
ncbi:MAG: glycosyltransferase [Aggregatilineales bacterium]